MKQKQKETINGIPIINTLNSDINRTSRNSTSKDKYKNLYKRDPIRRNVHTVKYMEESNKKITNNKKKSNT